MLLAGCGQQSSVTVDNDQPEMTTEEATEAVEAFNDLMVDETATGRKTVKASCNVIGASSSCVDYTGAYWENAEYAKLNCEGMGDVAERVFSTNACPYTDYGGCKSGAGTLMEMIIWAYPEGGGGYNDENIQYAAMACNATGVSAWTTPDAEFLVN